MLSTRENKNILLTAGGTTILSMGIGTAKIERYLWQVLELWHHPHTRILHALARNRVFTNQHFNNTDNKCDRSDTTELRDLS